MVLSAKKRIAGLLAQERGEVLAKSSLSLTRLIQEAANQ